MDSEFLERQKKDLVRDISALGSLFSYLLLMMLFLIPKRYDVFIRLLAGAILIYTVTILIRSFYFKERPNKYPYKSYIEKLDASSFPSLHSARIAFLSMVFIKHFNNVFLTVLIIILAIGVVYSRIELKKHDLKDVLGGVVVGFVIYLIIILNF